MKKLLVFIFLVFFAGSVNAEPVILTPVDKISTCNKDFQLGNSYKFKDVNSGEIYTGSVNYYRPNGFFGQEAQLEISNFINSKGKFVNGKITIIPNNHEIFQDFANYFTNSPFVFIRGSEVILIPNEHKFIIDNNSVNSSEMIIPIIPTEPINTCCMNIEYGDLIEFNTINDVYKKGKLYIKSQTKVYGIVDYVDENGWCADNAAIYFKEFKTKDVNNNKVSIKSDLTIDGFEILKYKSGRVKQFFNYVSTIVRGKEVDITSEDKNVKFVIILSE